MAPATWKRDFASGLIILLPILVSIYVIAYLYGILASAPFTDVIDKATLASLGLPNGTPHVTFVRVVVTVAVFIMLVFSIGYLMRTALGDLFENALDDLMNRVPGLRVVYNASKMAVETAVSGTEDLQTPVKLEPWDGMRMTAFKTGKVTEDGRDILFLPTAPNITSGYVIEVEPEDYEAIDERVEDALTRILSAGFGDTETEVPTLNIGAGDDEGEEGPSIGADSGPADAVASDAED